MYTLLSKFLLPNELEKEEAETKQLKSDWEKLVIESKSIRQKLQKEQKTYKALLLKNVATLTINVVEFKKKFDE